MTACVPSSVAHHSRGPNLPIRRRYRAIAAVLLLLAVSAATPRPDPVPIDWRMVARIREEGLQHSRVMDYESYMTDVLGARLDGEPLRDVQGLVFDRLRERIEDDLLAGAVHLEIPAGCGEHQR